MLLVMVVVVVVVVVTAFLAPNASGMTRRPLRGAAAKNQQMNFVLYFVPYPTAEKNFRELIEQIRK